MESLTCQSIFLYLFKAGVLHLVSRTAEAVLVAAPARKFYSPPLARCLSFPINPRPTSPLVRPHGESLEIGAHIFPCFVVLVVFTLWWFVGRISPTFVSLRPVSTCVCTTFYLSKWTLRDRLLSGTEWVVILFPVLVPWTFSSCSCSF